MSRHRAVRNLDLDDELYDDFGESAYDELQDISEEDEARLLEGVEAVKEVIGRGTGIGDQEIKETLYYYYFDIDASVAWLQKEHKLNKKGEDIDMILANARHRQRKPKSQMPSLVDLAMKSKGSGGSSSTPGPSGLGGLKKLSLGGANTAMSLKSLSSLTNSNSSGTGSKLVSLKSLSALGKSSTGIRAASSPSTAGSSSVVGKALAALKPHSTQQNKSQQVPTTAAKLGLAKTTLAGLQLKSSAPALKNFGGRTLPSLKPIASSHAGGDGPLGSAAGRTRASLAIDSLPVAPPTMYAEPSSLADFILKDITPTGQREMAADVVDQMQHEIRAIIEGNANGSVVDSESMETNRRDVTFLTALVGKKEKPKKQAFAFDTPSPDDKVFAAQSKATNAPAAAAGTKKKGKV